VIILYISMASQNTSSLISQIYNSRLTLLKQLNRQGYNTEEYQDFSVNEINTMKTNNQLDMMIEKRTKISDNEEEVKKIYVKYYLAKSLRPNNLEEMVDDLFNIEEILTKSDTLHVVVKDEVNDTLQAQLRHIWERDGIFIIIHPLKRLQYNVLEHILVPTHRVLTNAEKIEIMKKYNIMKDEEFPDLQRFDPVAKAIGIRPGGVCEILRPSKTAVTAPYYRICIQK
jgi:DNA-directed RNA polymerase subunit H (RpoH/RPB5)